MPTIENHKEMVPFEHYVGLYAKLDPAEAAARCGVSYDPVTQSFKMRLFYVDYELTWPVFSIRSEDKDGFALTNLPAQMLLIRYLLEGKASVGTELSGEPGGMAVGAYVRGGSRKAASPLPRGLGTAAHPDEVAFLPARLGIGIEVAGKVDAAPRNSYGGFESNGFDVFFHGRNRVFLIAGCQGERGRQQYGKQILCFHHHAPFLFS